MIYINCGCGEKYIVSDDWKNIDFVDKSNEVIAHNILDGLPFEDNYADAIFSSCMLEHFTKTQAIKFLKECYRVLIPRGIVRVVVPDMENWAKEYLRILELVRTNEKEYRKKYEYILIELIDQMTRMYPGGIYERILA